MSEESLATARLQQEMVAMKEALAIHRKETKEDFTALRTDVKGLLDAWNTAGGVLRVVKWVAGIAAGLGIMVSAAKGWLFHGQ